MQAAPEPIFVDPSGRRQRWARSLGAGVGLAFAAYLVLVAASFARAPWVPSLTLPGIGRVLPGVRNHLPPALGAAAVAIPAPDLASVLPGGATPSPRTSTPSPATSVPGSGG